MTSMTPNGHHVLLKLVVVLRCSASHCPKHEAAERIDLGPLGLGTPLRPKHFQPVSFGSTRRIRGVVRSISRLIEEATMRFIHLTLHWRHRDVLSKTTMYYVTDRLHDGRAVQVPGHQIASIVSAWLAELGADSPLVEDLARAACVGDWVSACAVGDQLSVDVAVAAAA
jgi:hypothetical protein